MHVTTRIVTRASGLMPLVLLALTACRQPPADAAGPYMPPSYVDHEADAALRVVFVGDGVTHGRGASADRLSYRFLLQANDSEAWPDADELDLESLAPNLDEVVSFTARNPTTAEILAEQLPAIEAALGDVVQGETLVVLTAGNKDLTEQESTVAEIVDQVEEILDFFADEERFPDGTWVYMSNLYNPADGSAQATDCLDAVQAGAVRSAIPQINRAWYDLAVDRQVALVDSYDHFLGHGYHFDDPSSPVYDEGDPSPWLDGCKFPNDRGHHELRRLFVAALGGEQLP
jgi:lysophospholipase L1-like esterase